MIVNIKTGYRALANFDHNKYFEINNRSYKKEEDVEKTKDQIAVN